MRAPASVALLAGLLAGAALDARSGGPARLSAQTPPTFTAGVILVPVDVSVTDEGGPPMTDLRQEDFTILEDGVHQEIRSFSARALTPQSPAGRTFLIVLGFGWIQDQTKPIDAMIRFVRDRLLPQDRVAVLAFNRITDLTTDHERVAQLVERYKRACPGIIVSMGRFTASNPALDLPDSIQSAIDGVFDPSTGRRHARSATDLIVQAAGHAANPPGDVPPAWNLAMARIDRLKAYAGIEFLRRLPGEKHLIAAVGGLYYPTVQDDERIAARASDARVVMDVLRTGNAGSTAAFFDIGALEAVSELTGGDFNGASDADSFLKRVDRSTRFGYLLGYTPSNTARDGRYREVTIEVSRPNATVLFRHGYHARDDVPALDSAELLAISRWQAPVGDDRQSHVIHVDAKASLTPAGARRADVFVEAAIDPSRVSLALAGGLRTGLLNVAIYCGDANQSLVGRLLQKVEVRLDAGAYAKALTDGIPFSAHLPVAAAVKYVKVIVYDYSADASGTAMITVSKPAGNHAMIGPGT